MNIIKHGDPKKAEETKRKKDIKRFRCPTCGALWDASISKKECRVCVQDYNDDRWVSDCPEDYCDGVGKEENAYYCSECKHFSAPSTCIYGMTAYHVENPAAAMTCGRFNMIEGGNK